MPIRVRDRCRDDLTYTMPIRVRLRVRCGDDLTYSMPFERSTSIVTFSLKLPGHLQMVTRGCSANGDSTPVSVSL